ncbi:MAG: hypothetical protein HC853_14685 [Anaerolineae bacterium]|nr:hypothetical protein [Anaerolineae bacterium]
MHLVDLATVRTPKHFRSLTLQSALIALPLLLTLGIFLLYLATYFAYAYNLFKFPFDYDQGEGFELYDAIRLARGENIYLDNAQFPFYASNYPPVYRTLLVPLIWLFGPKLYVGRAVAFACSLVIGGVIFLAARYLLRRSEDEGMRRFPSSPHLLIPLICALAFFAANYVYHVGPLARAHLPMVMFAIAGVYCLERAFDDAAGKPRRRTAPLFAGLAVALLMAAAFTKLQAVDALAAGFGFLLLRKPNGFDGVAGCLSFTLIFLLLMDKATAGQFWLNVVSANVNEYDIDVTWRTYYQWFCLQGALIVCSVVYVMWDGVAAIRARSFQPISIWSLYFVAGSALGMLTGKWGAGPTYLIAAIAASCVCTAGLFGRLLVNGYWLIRSTPITNNQLPITLITLLFAAVMLNPSQIQHPPARHRSLLWAGGADGGRGECAKRLPALPVLRHHWLHAAWAFCGCGGHRQRLGPRQHPGQRARPGVERGSHADFVGGQRRRHQPNSVAQPEQKQHA